ncbi:hypothetical protein [Catenulispora sp. EB89]
MSLHAVGGVAVAPTATGENALTCRRS